jgi:tRNA-dihydrouridine synthase 4
MNQRELVADMVTAAKAALEREGWKGKSTVSVKIRVHKDLRQTVDFVQTVQRAGADFITIHGRTRGQRSSEPVNLEAIKLVAEHINVPTLANGDVTTLKAAHDIASVTGVDGVMSARSLLENPALFKGYNSCPWEAVEKFMNYVIKAPIPFKLVVHHLGEMCGSGGHGDGGKYGISGALLTKPQRAELVACKSMLEVMDFLDSVRELKRF